MELFKGKKELTERNTRMEKVVLNYPRLKDRLDSKDVNEEKVLKNLYEIADEYRDQVIMRFKSLLDHSLNKLYDDINFTTPKDLDFKKFCQENNVVLVPNHQSHADYIAINYMVVKKYNFPLYIAGGNNLDIFPIGSLFRGSGCFFIRRSFHNDITYKLTLEAYLQWLLQEGKTIEFFFEGGRSRTGKLRSPRYGLYQMILEAYHNMDIPDKKPLYFLPVSINHEFVPEQRSMAKEMLGAKKKKESPLDLFGIFKMFSYQFGQIHINVGRPIEAPSIATMTGDEIKSRVQKLAFECFNRVGRNMVVTPTSILAFVLLEEPTGAIKWVDIKNRVKAILNYCYNFRIPTTDNLKKDRFVNSIERAMDILIGNKKVEVVSSPDKKHIFYTIKPNVRLELSYFKNTILHHFLIPWTISTAWIKIFNGKIDSVETFKEFFINQRNQLKYEFYLPTVMQFFHKTFKVVSHCIDRKITTYEEFLNLSRKDFYQIFSRVGVFSKAGSYIFEGYFISASALLHVMKEERGKQKFSVEEFKSHVKESFAHEISMQRVIRYQEGMSWTLIENSLLYFQNENIIKMELGEIEITDAKKLQHLVKEYETNLLEKLTFNINPHV